MNFKFIAVSLVNQQMCHSLILRELKIMQIFKFIQQMFSFRLKNIRNLNIYSDLNGGGGEAAGLIVHNS
jgi:hypothetical protein